MSEYVETVRINDTNLPVRDSSAQTEIQTLKNDVNNITPTYSSESETITLSKEE